jgi:CheY-like chemotaxis protein
VSGSSSTNALVLEMLLQLETPYHIQRFATAKDVLQRVEEIQAHKPVLFVFDYKLEPLTGVDLSQQLSVMAGLEQVPTILMTAGRFTAELERAIAQSPSLKLIYKPYDIDELLTAVQRAIG